MAVLQGARHKRTPPPTTAQKSARGHASRPSGHPSTTPHPGQRCLPLALPCGPNSPSSTHQWTRAHHLNPHPFPSPLWTSPPARGRRLCLTAQPSATPRARSVKLAAAKTRLAPPAPPEAPKTRKVMKGGRWIHPGQAVGRRRNGSPAGTLKSGQARFSRSHPASRCASALIRAAPVWLPSGRSCGPIYEMRYSG